jgi:hypothetical protein
MQKDLEGIYAELDHNNERDWNLYLILADWYEDQGNTRWAEACRWQAKHKRRACRFSSYPYARWELREDPQFDDTPISALPEILIDSMPKADSRDDHTYRYFLTLKEAHEALYRAYWKAKELGWDGTLSYQSRL